jgi:hypothetical protein
MKVCAQYFHKISFMQETLWRGGSDSIKVNLREVACEAMKAFPLANKVSYSTAKPMARVPKMITRKDFLGTRSIDCCPIFFISFA